MIDGSEKRNRQLAFELQNSHVCEKRSNKTRVRSVVTRSCCVSSVLRHGQKSRTSHSVHLTFGPFDNAVIRCYLVAHICGQYLRTHWVVEYVNVLCYVKAADWKYYQYKQWRKIVDETSLRIVGVGAYLISSILILVVLQRKKMPMSIKIHFKGYRTDKWLIK